MLPFICKDCIIAGLDPSLRDHHAKCRGGTWCDCQHVVPVPKS